MKTISLKLIVLLLIGIFFANKNLLAQTNYPPNIDFEQGTFNHWICNVGTCNINVGNNPPILTYPAIPTGANSVQQILRTSGTDYYGGFPVVNPITGNHFSLQLGDTLETAGSVCARAVYTLHIPVNVNNFSLQYYYALVLENGGHPYNTQPFFSVNVFDSSANIPLQGDSLLLVQPTTGHLSNFVPSPHLDKNNADSVYYLGWTPSVLNLNNLAGHTINIKFDASDCAGGAHSGYAYVDFNTSGLNPIVQTSCGLEAGISFAAPIGCTSYKWYDSTFTQVLDTNRIFYVNPVSQGTQKYYCIVTPINFWSAIDTLSIIVSPNTTTAQPIANFSAQSNHCANSPIQYFDSSYAVNAGAYISNWKWNFGDVNANGANPNTDTIKNPTHYYSALGTYSTCLIVSSNLHCVDDTICKTIYINKLQTPLTISSSKDSICGRSDSTIISFSGITQSTYAYQWKLDSATVLLAGNLNLANAIHIKFLTTGNHFIKLIATPPPTDTNCVAIGIDTVFVKGITPSFSILGVDSICANHATILSISTHTSNGAAQILCTSPTSYSVGNNSSGASGCTTCQPTPFAGFYTEGKMQMLFLASELNAAGLHGGNISQLAFNVLVKNSTNPACNSNGQFAGFTIKMAAVNYNSIYQTTAALDLAAPFTTVYSTNAYSSVLGINNFVFQTGYNWDGVSNLLVQTCYDAGTSCYTLNDEVAMSNMNAIFPNQNLCVYSQSDTYNACDSCYGNNGLCGGSATSTINRPDIIFGACTSIIPANTSINWSSNPAGLSSSQDSVNVSPAVTTNYAATANNNGCVSSVQHQVIAASKFNIVASANICQGNSYLFHGRNLITSGIYHDTIHSGAGCDTVFTLSLAVAQDTFYFNDTFCGASNYFYDTAFWFIDTILTQSGTYTFVSHHASQCDTVVILHLIMQGGFQANYMQSNNTLTCTDTGVAYQWIDCQTMQPIAGATNQSFTPSVSGSYAVSIKKGNCYDISSCYSIVITGISQIANSTIQIYPNPTEDNLFIKWTNAGDVKQILLKDMLGRIVLQNAPIKNETVLSLENLSAGIYFLTLQGANTGQTVKVIKQ